MTTFGDGSFARSGLGARFDDLQTGRALGFPAPDQILTAHHPEAVLPVLDAVTSATDAGAWAYGYVAYEAAAGLDPALSVHPTDPDGPPLAWFGLVSAPWRLPVLEDANQPDHGRPGAKMYSAVWRPGWTPQHYRRQVEVVRSHIASGETYQTNLTVRMRGRVEGDPLELYRDLALSQRGAYNAYLDLGRFVVASASPELFFQRRRDEVLLRPMKGTVRKSAEVSTLTAAEKILHVPKEEAENLMIVDLVRHDLYGVCGAGSVSVPDLLRVEEYATVFQMITVVNGQLPAPAASPRRADTANATTTTGLDVLAAALPPGSMTGAPKKRSCEILRGIEPGERSVYAGVVGYLGANGQGDWSVTIRTMFRWDDERDEHAGTEVWRIGAGGAVTTLSTPEGETDEMFTKLCGPLGVFKDVA